MKPKLFSLLVEACSVAFGTNSATIKKQLASRRRFYGIVVMWTIATIVLLGYKMLGVNFQRPDIVDLKWMLYLSVTGLFLYMLCHTTADWKYARWFGRVQRLLIQLYHTDCGALETVESIRQLQKVVEDDSRSATEGLKYTDENPALETRSNNLIDLIALMGWMNTAEETPIAEDMEAVWNTREGFLYRELYK